jgi:hypothetical protein
MGERPTHNVYVLVMGRPKEHVRVIEGRNCLGAIQGVYVRKGAGSGRWVKLGEMCLRCNEFWPLDPEATAEEIVSRAVPGAYVGA